MTLYRDIANKIAESIDNKLYLPGDRLPGVRRLGKQFSVSISTIVQAQQLLENRGLIKARPRSGYYICQRPWVKPEPPSPSQPEIKPMPVMGQKLGQELVLQLAKLTHYADFVPLGAAVPDASFMPMRAFQRSLSKVARNYNHQSANYVFPPGLPALQLQLAKRMYFTGSKVKPHEILISNGCQEALLLALQSVAKSGDVIVIESPTFYGLLQVIESLGMKALEIPTDPQQGISLSALELAMEQWSVKACVLIPNFSNPLGSLLSDSKKKQLVTLAKTHDVMLIEDDIYGDLAFNGERPRSLHSFDPDRVIYCSSFSKTISQGVRLGWMVLPEAYRQRAEYLKYVTNLAAPTLAQMALADYLEQGGYDRFLGLLQARYSQQINLFTYAISKYFPKGTRVTQPKGGFILWVELAAHVDTLELNYQALQQKISIAPGQIFSASQKYQNFIRLNCAQPWDDVLETALMKLGRLAKQK